MPFSPRGFTHGYQCFIAGFLKLHFTAGSFQEPAVGVLAVFICLTLTDGDQRLGDEGIRNNVSLVAGGSIRSASDVVKAVALGADACYIATAALLALGCHLCRTCQTGKCNWGIATQRPDLVKRLNPNIGSERLVNLMTAWRHEIMELMGGMGINSIEALRGNRLMLRGVGLNEKELEILGISHAGE